MDTVRLVFTLWGAFCMGSVLVLGTMLMTASLQFLSEISSSQQKYLTMRARGWSPAFCMTGRMTSTTCLLPLRPTSTWRGRGYKTRITLPQFLPINARVGPRPFLRWAYCITDAALLFKVSVVGQCCQAQTVVQLHQAQTVGWEFGLLLQQTRLWTWKLLQVTLLYL